MVNYIVFVLFLLFFSSRATNATANAVADNRASTPGAAIEREPRLLLVGGVKQEPRLLPASSRDGSHLNMGDACVWCVCHLWWRKAAQNC